MFFCQCMYTCSRDSAPLPTVSLSVCCPAVMQIILPVRAEHSHNMDDYQCLHSRSLCMLKLFIGRLLQVGLIKLVSMSVHPSTKSFSDFSEIWYVDWGLWVIHDGVRYDLIQGQGLKVKVTEVPKLWKRPISNLLHLCACNQKTNGKLRYSQDNI